jgi:large subunit ribosomal protein L15
MRGFKSSRIHPKTITLLQLDRWFDSGSEVSVKNLKARNLIPMNVPSAKVVNTGEITKRLTLVDLKTSPTAKAAIEKAGGKVTDIPAKKKGKSISKVAKKPSKK